MSRQCRKQLPQLVAFLVFLLAAKECGRHFVGLIADDEIPPTFGRFQLLLNVLVARELVESRNGQICFQEPVPRAGSFEFVIGEDLEWEVEPAVQFILPLFDQTAWADYEAALKVAARNQLLHEQAGHDRLAGSGIVSQQKTQRLTRQHRLVDGGNLMWERIDDGGVYG